MKKLFLITITALTIHANAQTGTWISLNSGVTNHLLGVSVVNSNTCYVCGVAGIILKTTDGGGSWHSQTSGTNEDLYSICFTDSLHGVAVGNGGAMIRTTNAGATWTNVSMTTDELRNVSFYNSNTGFAVGGVSSTYGSIFKTTDGGATWNQQTVFSSDVLYSIDFTSLTEGYCCNGSGEIFKTINGGTSWTLLSGSSANSLFLLDFLSTTKGIIVGNSGTILKTTNSGALWSTVPSGTTDLLCGLKFINTNLGYAVGGNVGMNTGIILKTTDGGNTWTMNTPGTSRLYRVDFANTYTGYAVGFDGTILKFNVKVGIDETLSSNGINIYPNPFNSQTTISFSSNQNNVSIRIMDILGEEIKTINFTGSQLILEKENLKEGVYFVQISDMQHTKSNMKIVIQ